MSDGISTVDVDVGPTHSPWHQASDHRHRVTATVSFRPVSPPERAGDTLERAEGRTRGDLDRFRDFDEEQREASGDRRGTIETN